MNRKQLETEIERAHREDAIAAGWMVEKIIRTGRSGFPDRFYARDGRIVFLEWKRPGGRVGKQQLLRHRELRKAGVEVYVVYSVDEADAILYLENGQGCDSNQGTLDL